MNASKYPQGYIRVAAVSPKVTVGNVRSNCVEIAGSCFNADQEDATVIVFPELCLTGYTAQDLFLQELLQEQVIAGLKDIAEKTSTLKALIIVGLPLVIDGMLFNIAAGIQYGKVLGFVPKTNIPNYGEFYERRWFASGRALKRTEVDIYGRKIPIGRDLLFADEANRHIVLGIEVCEDLWMPLPPSSFQAVAGATIIVNISASNELVGKAAYRRELVKGQSARGICAYVYASCGPTESTSDVVFGGHCLIAENNSILSESKLFQYSTQIITADIDVQMLVMDRTRTTSFGECAAELGGRTFRTVHACFYPRLPEKLERPIERNPFIKKDPIEQEKVLDTIWNIQKAGLTTRLHYSGIKNITLGLSGGRDSTLALLLALEAQEMLGLPKENMRAITMPGFATSHGTKSGAHMLAKAAGISLREIPINDDATSLLKAIGHTLDKKDIAYENAQARVRTINLFNLGNLEHALVLGTGNLSEGAIGWCTFNGDHMSHYHINCGVPKTIIRLMLAYKARQYGEAGNPELRDAILWILNSPESPELKCEEEGKLSQKTDDEVGPNDLRDFYLYHFQRWGFDPRRILYLANQAYDGVYTQEETKHWLKEFLKRFFGSQWKRNTVPDGPKVGSVSLSPRGDWRMPVEVSDKMWIEQLDE